MINDILQLHFDRQVFVTLSVIALNRSESAIKKSNISHYYQIYTFGIF